MKRIELILLVIVAMIAVVGVTQADEEATFAADGGLRVYDHTDGTGASMFDVATDGTATIKFMWLKNDGTANAGDVLSAEPVGIFGNAVFTLRSTLPPRHFDFQGSTPDSVYVDVTTATEVILTW